MASRARLLFAAVQADRMLYQVCTRTTVPLCCMLLVHMVSWFYSTAAFRSVVICVLLRVRSQPHQYFVNVLGATKLKKKEKKKPASVPVSELGSAQNFFFSCVHRTIPGTTAVYTCYC